MTRIESAANPLIKRIRALEQRKGREEQGAFFVEGIQPVWQAVEAGAPIETLVVAQRQRIFDQLALALRHIRNLPLSASLAIPRSP